MNAATRKFRLCVKSTLNRRALMKNNERIISNDEQARIVRNRSNASCRATEQTHKHQQLTDDPSKAGFVFSNKLSWSAAQHPPDTSHEPPTTNHEGEAPHDTSHQPPTT